LNYAPEHNFGCGEYLEGKQGEEQKARRKKKRSTQDVQVHGQGQGEVAGEEAAAQHPGVRQGLCGTFFLSWSEPTRSERATFVFLESRSGSAAYLHG
jgi:hypothetical protein